MSTIETIRKFLELAPTVSQFNSVFSYQSWKKSIHTLLDTYTIPDENLLSLLEFLVRDEVGELIARAHCTDVAHFWNTLDKSYGDVLHRDEADNLFSLIHPPRTITSVKGYITYFNKYFQRLDNKYFTEKGQIALFLSTLNKVIVEVVKTQHPSNLKEAQEIALSNAQIAGKHIFRPPINNMSYLDSNKSFSTECFYCHTEHFCKKKRLNRNYQRRQFKKNKVKAKSKVKSK